MAEQTLFWLASTVAQVFAALVALVALVAVFSVLFIESLNRMRDREIDRLLSDDEVRAWVNDLTGEERDPHWAYAWILHNIKRVDGWILAEQKRINGAEVSNNKPLVEARTAELKKLQGRRIQLDTYKKRFDNLDKQRSDAKSTIVEVAIISLILVGLSILAIALNPIHSISNIVLVIVVSLGSLIGLVGIGLAVSKIITKACIEIEQPRKPRHYIFHTRDV